eukprot:Tbor_TRINITY_DN3091_c0_g1::TRINITY_DN3091_c0_g1_i1::g.17314::m.17314
MVLQESAHLLLSPVLRERIHRCQKWRELIAKKPLQWILIKVALAERSTPFLRELGKPMKDQDMRGPPSDEVKRRSVDEVTYLLSIAPLLNQKRTPLVNSHIGVKRPLRDSTDDSNSGDGVISKRDEGPECYPHLESIGTFFMISSGAEDTESSNNVNDGNGSTMTAPTKAAVSSIERPELFMCLLYRALMISSDIPSETILALVEQPQKSNVNANHSLTSSTIHTKDKIHEDDTKETNSNEQCFLRGNKYLRIFAVFLGRFVFAQRKEPQNMCKMWKFCEGDYRKLRVLKCGGVNGRDSMVISTVDQVAYELLTDQGRWNVKLPLPRCVPLMD